MPPDQQDRTCLFMLLQFTMHSAAKYSPCPPAVAHNVRYGVFWRCMILQLGTIYIVHRTHAKKPARCAWSLHDHRRFTVLPKPQSDYMAPSSTTYSATNRIDSRYTRRFPRTSWASDNTQATFRTLLLAQHRLGLSDRGHARLRYAGYHVRSYDVPREHESKVGLGPTHFLIGRFAWI
jgi:hypothetical protein